MKQRHLYALLGGILLALGASAQEAAVTIVEPADNAKLDAKARNKVVYEVVPGAKGDHTHLYLDGKELAVLRQLKGSHALEALTPGNHELCIKVVNKGHTPIGVEKCVKVKAE